MQVKHEYLVLEFILVDFATFEFIIDIIQLIKLFLKDFLQQFWELLDVDETFASLVKLDPDVIELVDGALSDLETLLSLRWIETFQDNGDEEIEENEGYNDHETDEVDVGSDGISASLDTVLFQWFVFLGIGAFENDGFLSSAIVHDFVPRFTGGHSEQGKQSYGKVLEVGVNWELVLKLDASKSKNTKNGVQKEEKEQQKSDVGELWERINEGIEQDSQIFVLLNDFEDPTNSEWSDDRCWVTDFKAEVAREHTQPGCNYDGDIEFVPAISEVVSSECSQLDSCLNGVSDVESKVNRLQDSLQIVRFIIPGKGQAEGVDHDATENEVFKEPVSSDLMAFISEHASSRREFDQRLRFVAHDQNFAPVGLHLVEHVVHLKCFLFGVENIDDDTYEHIQNEQGTENHEKDEESDL